MDKQDNSEPESDVETQKITLSHVVDHLPVIQSYSHYSCVPSSLMHNKLPETPSDTSTNLIKTKLRKYKEPVCLGVDEAGRGPVLGPMVYAYAFVPISRKADLKNLGVDDSKVLKEDERDRLFEVMLKNEDWIGWAVHVCSPRDISESMLRKVKYSLNDIAHDATIGLIKGAQKLGLDVSEVFIDTVGDPKKYQTKLEGIFPGVSITVAKKADSLYPVVSAASICAKVTRDAILSQWKYCEKNIESKIERNFGSGYPSDPNTTRWLRDNVDPIFGYPQLIRFSWSTCEILLNKHAVSVRWPDEEENRPGQDIRGFFKSDPAPSDNGKRKLRSSSSKTGGTKRTRTKKSAMEEEEEADLQDEDAEISSSSETEAGESAKVIAAKMKRNGGEFTSKPSLIVRDPLFADLGLQHITHF
ncbi:Ribonuclease H2 subunit A [Nowakowskiella sp. JEL0407]|nr:Ribonuclease H2 subunit A [Nowakowskiella sp. JEL0407]